MQNGRCKMFETVWEENDVEMTPRGLLRAKNGSLIEHVILSKMDEETWLVRRWIIVRKKGKEIHRPLACRIPAKLVWGDRTGQLLDAKHFSLSNSCASETFMSFLELFLDKKGGAMTFEYRGNNSSTMLEKAGLKGEMLRMYFSKGTRKYEAGVTHPYEYDTQRMSFRM